MLWYKLFMNEVIPKSPPFFAIGGMKLRYLPLLGQEFPRMCCRYRNSPDVCFDHRPFPGIRKNRQRDSNASSGSYDAHLMFEGILL